MGLIRIELRKDYVLDRWTIIATGRGKRPHQFRSEENIYAKDPGHEKCFFCPGNENMTPPEIGRIKDGKCGWKMRWFANKFAAVDRKGNPEIRHADDFFSFSDAFGDHEIIVETNDHHKQLYDLDENEILDLLRIYADRIDALLKKDGVKYVNVFKNEGTKAGTSLIHSHSQVISLNMIPKEVKDKIDASKKFDSCPYCSIAAKETEGKRKIYDSGSFSAFAPYASRFNFEVLILPKEHKQNFRDFSLDEMHELAGIVKRVLEKLKELNASFNMVVHYSPEGEDLHFQISILPRISTWAGFELGSGVTINAVSPEDAAAFYRGEHK